MRDSLLVVVLVTFTAGLMLAALRWAAAPAVAYWLIVSFVSLTALAAVRLRIAGIPISLLDLTALVMLLALIRVGRSTAPNVLRSWTLTGAWRSPGFALNVFCAFSLIPVLVGLAHHSALYSVLIDLRTIAYLAIGYWAGRLLLDIVRYGRPVLGLLAATALGFAFAQAIDIVRELGIVARTGINLIDRRDLGVPFFTGKYGIFVGVLGIRQQGLRKTGVPALLVAAGFMATVLTLIRTAWLTTTVGIIVLLIFWGWRTAGRVTLIASGSLVLLLAAVLVTPVAHPIFGALTNQHVTIANPTRTAAPSLQSSPAPSSTGASASPGIQGPAASASPGIQGPAASASPAIQGPTAAGGSVSVAPSPTPRSLGTDTVQFRLAEAGAALSHLKHPLDWILGVGFGLNVDDPIHPYQHNSFVWVLSQEGLVGLVLFTWGVVLTPLIMAVGALRRAPANRDLLVVLIAVQVANIVSGAASGHLTSWPFAPIVGMTIAWMESLSLARTETMNGDLS